MRSSIFVSVAAFAGAAVAQSSSVDPAPQTNYLTQTNSLGVVTGGPAAVTTQPSVITSQPAVATNVGTAASIPAVAPGIWTIPLPAGGNNTSLISYIVSANNSTTVILNGPTSSGATATGSGASATGSGAATKSGSASGSATGSGSASSSQGAAANVQVAAGSLLGFGALMAAFL